MNKLFIAPEEGKNTYLRYFITMFSIFIGIGTVTMLCYFGAMLWAEFSNGAEDVLDVEVFEKQYPVLGVWMQFLSSALWVPVIWVSVRLFLKRSLTSLITPHERIDFKRIFYGMKVFGLLLVGSYTILWLTHMDQVSFFVADWKDYLLVVALSLCLIPFQALGEELIFRGIFLQMMARISRQTWWLLLTAGGIFGALHFSNPEMSNGWIVGVSYVMTGFALTLITIKTNSAELSIGGHVMNNMFVCLFISEENSVSTGIRSMFFLHDINANWIVIIDIIVLCAFFVIANRKYGTKSETASDKDVA